MKHIGDDYFEFRCRCGENVLVRSGDLVCLDDWGFLCGGCGKGKPAVTFGERSEDVVCEICRTRMSPEVWNDFNETHEDGERTALCRSCLDLGGNEGWKS